MMGTPFLRLMVWAWGTCLRVAVMMPSRPLVKPARALSTPRAMTGVRGVFHPAGEAGGDEGLAVGLAHGEAFARLLAHPVLEKLDPLHG